MPLTTGAENVRWDLSDLYNGFDDPAYLNDRERVQAKADSFASTYRGRLSHLTPEELASAIQSFEALTETVSRLGSFAYLAWTTDTENPALGKAVQQNNELSSDISQKLVFFSLEWLELDEEQALAFMSHPALEPWRHYLQTSRLQKPYRLEEKQEQMLAAKSVTGRQAWVRFFDETLGATRFELREETLSEAEILSRLHHADREVRKEAAQVFTSGLKKLRHPLTYVFNTLLADKAANDRMRGYPHWLSSRNLSNEISDESVQVLVDSVTGRYNLVHRYYKLKKRLLGVSELYDYDRYAPVAARSQTMSWDEARSVVLQAFGAFHPEMEQIASQFFDSRWSDAAVVPGKRGGAYSASTVPSVHPYVFMNYEGRIRDVQTLAHELGHGVHQYLSRGRGVLQSDTPLTTAETASVFAEMLVFKELLGRQTDPSARLALLMGKIDDSMATVFRQVSMNRFEHLMHQVRRSEGELTSERFGELWFETQHALYGNSVTLTDNYRLWWSYIPHFLHTPGYVYAYAFGELLVLALHNQFMHSPDGFQARYLRMLRMGGSQWPHEMMLTMGVDINEHTFWEKGLDAIGELVAQAESLADQVQGIQYGTGKQEH